MAGVKSALCSAAAVVLGACAPYAASRLGFSGLPFAAPRDFLGGNSGWLSEFFAAANPLFAAVLLYGFSLAAFLVSGARGRTPTVAARILAAAVAAAVAAAPVAAAVAAADKLLLKKGSSGEWAGRRTNIWQGRFKKGALLFFLPSCRREDRSCVFELFE